MDRPLSTFLENIQESKKDTLSLFSNQRRPNQKLNPELLENAKLGTVFSLQTNQPNTVDGYILTLAEARRLYVNQYSKIDRVSKSVKSVIFSYVNNEGNFKGKKGDIVEEYTYLYDVPKTMKILESFSGVKTPSGQYKWKFSQLHQPIKMLGHLHHHQIVCVNKNHPLSQIHPVLPQYFPAIYDLNMNVVIIKKE